MLRARARGGRGSSSSFDPKGGAQTQIIIETWPGAVRWRGPLSLLEDPDAQGRATAAHVARPSPDLADLVDEGREEDVRRRRRQVPRERSAGRECLRVRLQSRVAADMKMKMEERIKLLQDLHPMQPLYKAIIEKSPETHRMKKWLDGCASNEPEIEKLMRCTAHRVHSHQVHKTHGDPHGFRADEQQSASAAAASASSSSSPRTGDVNLPVQLGRRSSRSQIAPPKPTVVTSSELADAHAASRAPRPRCVGTAP